MQHYDGSRLLSMQDLYGKRPELYLCTTNRSAGKTTWFSRYCVKKFLETGSKFCLVYRYKYEIANAAEKFFPDIKKLFFNGYEMTQTADANGQFARLYLNDIHCGYAVALNSADNLKKYSHLLSDVERMFFDEFQSESGRYCSDEIRKFISVHTSISRGGGKSVRYVPVYMCGNTVTLLNPYYVELGISDRLQDNTKFLRGDGFVLEHGFLEGVSNAQKESGFNRAFGKNKYVAYSTQNVYLNDSKAFVESVTGKSKYLCTLRYEECEYAIREYAHLGLIYCDNRVDSTFPYKITVTTEDHDINYVMLKTNDTFLGLMRFYFENGCFRFKNIKCKEAVLKALSY